MSHPDEPSRSEEQSQMLRTLRERIATATDPKKLKLLSEQCERIVQATGSKKPRAA